MHPSNIYNNARSIMAKKDEHKKRIEEMREFTKGMDAVW